MHKKKSFMEKINVRLIPMYPTNLATFKESSIFGRPGRSFWTLMAPKRDLDWYEIFHPNFIFSTLRIFFVKMASSEEGGCISLVGTGPEQNFLYLISNRKKSIQSCSIQFNNTHKSFSICSSVKFSKKRAKILTNIFSLSFPLKYLPIYFPYHIPLSVSKKNIYIYMRSKEYFLTHIYITAKDYFSSTSY